MIGIDISDRSIKVADVHRGRIESVGRVSLPAGVVERGEVHDMHVVAAYLRSALAGLSRKRRGMQRAVVGIPEVQCFMHIVRVPHAPRRGMRDAVLWAIRDDIPFDPTEAYVHWKVLSKGEKSHQDVLVFAAPKHVVDALVGVVHAAGLYVYALEPEPQAIARCLFEEDDRVSGVLAIDMGAVTTDVFFLDRGHVRHSISIPCGGGDLACDLARRVGISEDAAHDHLMATGLVDQGKETAYVAHVLRGLVRDMLENIITRVEGGRGFDSIHVKSAVLSGGVVNMPGLYGLAREMFEGVPVSVGVPWIYNQEETPYVPVSRDDAVYFVTAIGLALRTRKDQGLYLYPSHARRAFVSRVVLYVVYVFAVIAIVLLAALLGSVLSGT